MYGEYHLHKQKWANNKPNIMLFKIELKHYIEAIKYVFCVCVWGGGIYCVIPCRLYIFLKYSVFSPC